MTTVLHFAELENNIVLRVLAVAKNDCLDSSGVFQETIGENLCRRLTGSLHKWIECSNDGSVRKNSCSPGDIYDENMDGFYNPNSPQPSWVLDDNLRWQSPIPCPENVEGFVWIWDEPKLTWVKVKNTTLP